MPKSIFDTKNNSGIKKGPGRPKTGIGPNVGLRLHPELSDSIDRWISERPDPKPSRPEAIRTLLQLALGLKD